MRLQVLSPLLIQYQVSITHHHQILINPHVAENYRIIWYWCQTSAHNHLGGSYHLISVFFQMPSNQLHLLPKLILFGIGFESFEQIRG